MTRRRGRPTRRAPPTRGPPRSCASVSAASPPATPSSLPSPDLANHLARVGADGRRLAARLRVSLSAVDAVRFGERRADAAPAYRDARRGRRRRAVDGRHGRRASGRRRRGRHDPAGVAARCRHVRPSRLAGAARRSAAVVAAAPRPARRAAGGVFADLVRRRADDLARPPALAARRVPDASPSC